MYQQVTIKTFDNYVNNEAIAAAIDKAKRAFYAPELLRDEERCKSVFVGHMLRALGAAALPHVYGTILDRLNKSWGMFLALHGPRPEADEAALDWDDELDEAIAASLAGQFRKEAGIDWTEEHTVDVRAHDGMERDALALKAAEKYIEAINDRGGNKALSHYGVVEATWLPVFDAMWSALKTNATTKGKPSDLSVAQARRRVEEVLNPYVANAGDRLDLDNLQMLLANAADRDPLIAAASITELGGEPVEDHGAFRIYASDAGSTWMESVISNAIEGVFTPMEEGDGQAVVAETASEAPQGQAADAAGRTGDEWEIPPALDRRAKAPATEAAPPAATEPSVNVGHYEDEPRGDAGACLAALRVLRDSTSLKDQDIADMLGVARATVTNYVKGSTNWDPTPEQQEALRLALTEYQSKVTGALLALSEADAG